MSEIDVDKIQSVSELKSILLSEESGIRPRMNCLFRLRTIATMECVLALEEALIKEKSSDLLRHEVCYVFGQMTSTEENKAEIQSFLTKEVFEDPNKYTPIVLHEAAEALGNINFEQNKTLLEKFINSPLDIIKETCEISIANLDWMIKTKNGESEGLLDLKLIYKTNDPAPPFNYKKETKYADLQYLSKVMHDTNESMFDRYRVIFTLRELNSDSAVKVLCESFDKNKEKIFSPLFKHEVCFILGQMASNAKSAVSALEEVILLLVILIFDFYYFYINFILLLYYFYIIFINLLIFRY